MTTRRERSESVVVEGHVVADFGREFLVEFSDKRQVVCTRKGKRQDATCGDFVEVRLTGSAQGSIERVGTRRNLLYRSDQWREKMLAANVDQVVILLAPKPPFSEAFLNLSGQGCMDFPGGLHNASGGNGDVLIGTTGFDAGASYSVRLEFRK